MKRVVVVFGVAFVVALAVVVGNRMSGDAIAVVVGVTCGVVASIPTSLLVIWASSRRGGDAGAYRDRPSAAMGMGSHYPPVVVVNSGEGYARPNAGLPPYWLEQGQAPLMAEREFKVVGDPDSASDWTAPRWAGRG